MFDRRVKLSRDKLLLTVVIAIIISGPFLDAWYSMIRFQEPTIGVFSPLQLIRGALLVVLVVLLFPYTRQFARNIPLLWPVSVLVGCSALFAMFHDDIVANAVYGMGAVFVLYMLLAGYRLAWSGYLTEARLQHLAWGVAGLIIGIQLLAYIAGSRHYNPYALVGAGGRPSVTAVGLAALCPALLLRLRRYPLGALIMLTITSTALVLTFRRSSIIAFGVAIAVAFFWEVVVHGRRQMRRTVVVIGCALLVFGTWGMLAGTTPLAPAFEERLIEMNPAAGGTASGRFEFWPAAVETSFTRGELALWVGEGIGKVPEAIGRHFHRPITAHNIWLEALVGLGLVGLVVIGWFYVSLFRSAIRTASEVQAPALAAFTVLFLGGLPQGGILSPTWAFTYLTLGFCIGLSLRAPNTWRHASRPDASGTLSSSWYGHSLNRDSRA